MTDHGTHADPAPLDTAQLRSWARWCPGQTNLMCLNHLLHRAADEIDRLRDVEAERDQFEQDALFWRGKNDERKARLAAVEALCDDFYAGKSTGSFAAHVLRAARGEAPDA